jgi:hypothetical protein
MSESRRHVLQGVLRRWARSSQAAALVLRGGLMTQLWVGPQRRTTKDIDFVGLFPFDHGDALGRIEEILSTAVEDGVAFDLATLRGEVIWPETDFPGMRFLVQTTFVDAVSDLQIDVGVGDPIIPAAEWIDYPALIGEPMRIQAVRPELLVAWKLDGLFDHGPKRWLAKDLFDLYLLTSHCQLDIETLSEAIRVAFEAHGDPLEDVPAVVYSRAWWEQPASGNKWAKFRATAEVPVPEDLLLVATTVAEALRPALARLVALPDVVS